MQLTRYSDFDIVIVQILKGLLKEVHVLPSDDRYPDCVFVEDPVVVCGNTALLTILGMGQIKWQ